MKNLSILLFMMFVTQLAYGWGSPQPKKPAPPVQAPEVYVPISMPDSTRTYVISQITGTVHQVSRLARITKTVEDIINTPKFKSRVLGQHYNRKAQFVDTTLSNEEVYVALMRGHEIQGQHDKLWELEIELDKTDCSTLGWTYPSVKKFWFNTCGFDERSDSGIAGTICHEYSHKLGFSHSKYNNSARPYSVPYSVGTICAEIYSEVIKAGE